MAPLMYKEQWVGSVPVAMQRKQYHGAYLSEQHRMHRWLGLEEAPHSNT